MLHVSLVPILFNVTTYVQHAAKHSVFTGRMSLSSHFFLFPNSGAYSFDVALPMFKLQRAAPLRGKEPRQVDESIGRATSNE